MLTIEKIEKRFDEEFGWQDKHPEALKIKTFILDTLKEFGLELAGEREPDYTEDYGATETDPHNYRAGRDEIRNKILNHPLLKEL